MYSFDETAGRARLGGYVPQPGDVLQIESRDQTDGATLLILRGELDIVSAQTLEDVLLSVEGAQPRSIVLDLSDLRFIDSSGLRVLVHAQLRATHEHRPLLLTNLHRTVRRLFDVAGVNSQFTIT